MLTTLSHATTRRYSWVVVGAQAIFVAKRARERVSDR
jgi:hypothetical protein